MVKDNYGEGQGKRTWTNGDSYTGIKKAGQLSGLGKFTYTNGVIYEGMF